MFPQMKQTGTEGFWFDMADTQPHTETLWERTGIIKTQRGPSVLGLGLWSQFMTKTKSRSLGHISHKIKNYCVKSVSINGNAINKAVLL